MEDGWIEWKGGECPVDLETFVEVESRDGYCSEGKARSFLPPENETNWWSHQETVPIFKDASPRDCDIIRYRVVQS